MNTQAQLTYYSLEVIQFSLGLAGKKEEIRANEPLAILFKSLLNFLSVAFCILFISYIEVESLKFKVAEGL